MYRYICIITIIYISFVNLIYFWFYKKKVLLCYVDIGFRYNSDYK